METDKNVFRRIWIISIVYITYLLLGSFIVSRNLYDLAYLIVFHILNTMAEISNKKEENNSSDV